MKLDRNRNSFILAVIFSLFTGMSFIWLTKTFTEFGFGMLIISILGAFWNWLKFLKTR
jgi:hypothetical protein